MAHDVDHRGVGGRSMRPMRLASGVVAAAVVGVAAFGAGASGAASTDARAVAARTLTLNESGRLHLTTHHGLKLNEQGTASGTIKGSIYIHLNVSSTNRVTAEVSIYPKGGSLSGNGTAKYGVVGGVATFTGTLSITRGTGSYAHAHGTGLRFTGTIQRRSDAVTVHVSGPLSV